MRESLSAGGELSDGSEYYCRVLTRTVAAAAAGQDEAAPHHSHHRVSVGQSVRPSVAAWGGCPAAHSAV